MSGTRATSRAMGGGNAEESFQEQIEPVEPQQSGAEVLQLEEPAVENQEIPVDQDIEEEGEPEAEGPHVEPDVQENLQLDPGDVYENGPEFNETAPHN
ncbi:putative G antigen family E member 3 isoform X2 [Oryctolagus cuniculus]